MASVDQIRRHRDGWYRAESIACHSGEPADCCPLCESADIVKAFTDNGCALRMCNVCELFFVDPHPRGKEQHDKVSTGKYLDIEVLDCERRYEGERLYYDRHFSLIADECKTATSLLDVGCGTGRLLERFSGWPGLRRTGIELNSEAARFARRVAGCEIIEIPFEEFRSERKYDAITMINVLSHIPSFGGMFRSLRAALKPGGKAIVRTSEMSRSVSRWNQIHWGVPDDLHFLGLGTLDFLCAKYGFTILKRIRTPYEDELFRHSRWQQMGRNKILNTFKRAGVRIPGALESMKRIYTAVLGRRFYISFIVLKVNESSG
jgi:SAM-dependent methyltransferase